VIVSEPDEVRDAFVKRREQLDASYEEAVLRQQRAPDPHAIATDWTAVGTAFESSTALQSLALGDAGEMRHIACQPAMEFSGRIADWVSELRQSQERGDTVVFVANSQGRAERVIEMLGDYDVPASPIERGEDSHHAAVLVAIGRVSKGFRLPDAALQLWAETDVFDEERRLSERRRSATRTFLSDFRDLKVGDLVVHVDHGIGVFVGLKRIEVGLEPQEFMELRYAGEDKLFVPVERLDLVQ
jgi:transcription-repair coupling factor (superfamily II helicase)